jgi:inward rectifier potassium channel
VAIEAPPTVPGFEPSPLAPRRTEEELNRDRDLGFGAVVSRRARQRLLNRDGSLNVVRSGLGLLEAIVPYHHLLTMTWPSFLALVTALYFVINLAFALLYVLSGRDALVGGGAEMLGGRFSQAFYFSVQTFATIGYGQIAPNGFAANFLVTIEALVGLMYQALATGLLFARFARPAVSIAFSDRAIIAPYNGGLAFEFRVANRRHTQVMNLEAQVIYSWMNDEGRGGRVRRYRVLSLERNRVTFFPLTWTVVHPIDPSSPLHGSTAESLERDEAEVLIVLSGTDETSGQVVHARCSYVADEIVWGARFRSIYPDQGVPGALVGDISRLHDIELVNRDDEPARPSRA